MGTLRCELGLTHFGVPHLIAAARHSRAVKALEDENIGKPFGPFYDEVLGDSSACILLCVAGLEAYINEFFADR